LRVATWALVIVAHAAAPALPAEGQTIATAPAATTPATTVTPAAAVLPASATTAPSEVTTAEPTAASESISLQPATDYDQILDGTGRSIADGSAWVWYVGGGVAVPLDGHFAAGDIDTGWTTRGGLRLPMGNRDGLLDWHVDLGLGYTRFPGSGPRVTTSGVFYAFPDDHSHPVENFQTTTLDDYSRIDFQALLGASWQPLLLNRGGDFARFHARFGPRLGGYSLRQGPFAATEELVLLMASHFAHGHTPDQFEFRRDVEDSGMFFGLVGSVGFGLMWPDAAPLGLPLGDVTLEADFAFGIDWHDLDGFTESDDTLLTLAPMLELGFTF
jgi:hypothetical protein